MKDLIGKPPSDKYVLAYEEDFNGSELNREEWEYRTGERFDGINLPENVTVSDGRLQISFDRNPQGTPSYTCGGIISKGLFGYGYYEAKGKLWGRPGIHASFWSMGRNGGDGKSIPKFNTIIEIDGYEVDSAKPWNIAFNYHWYIGRHCSRGHEVYSQIDSSMEEFIAGYEWLPGKVNFYINNLLVHTVYTSKYKGNFYGPQNVWLTALAWDIDGKSKESFQPGRCSWDWFRFYKRDLAGVNLLANPAFEYNTYGIKKQELKKDLFHPVGWIKSGNTSASYIIETSEGCRLCHSGETPFRTVTAQNIFHLMPGEYTLFLRVSSTENHTNCYAAVMQENEDPICLMIPKTQGFEELSLPGVRISASTCRIELISESLGGEMLLVDEIRFFQTNVEPDEDLTVFLPDLPEQQLPKGAILIDDFDEDFSCVGTWEGGATLGYDYGPTSYCFIRTEEDLHQNYAMWTPKIPEEGIYEVSFFVSSHPGSAKDAKITVFHKNGESAFLVDFSTPENKWISLGNFVFEKEKTGCVKLTAGSIGCVLRADAVLFVKKD